MSPHPGNAAEPTSQDRGHEFDLVGGGVTGLTAALLGALAGQRVVLLQKSRWVGGTSARSSGTVWIPDNPCMRREGFTDDAQRAMQYLDALVGDRAAACARPTWRPARR